MIRRSARSGPLPIGLWMLGLVGIGLLVWWAVDAMTVSPLDRHQQQDLLELLARGDLVRSLAVGDPPQTSGPGYALFGVPIYWVVRPFTSAMGAYDIVSFACLVPVAFGALAASRVLGVVARSARELLNVAGVMLGVPLLGCYTDAFHPSDVLAVGACLGAFAAVARSRLWLAAGLLGFAFATRQWAVVAVVVLAVLLRGRDRWVLIGGSAAVAALLLAPFLIANPHATIAALRAEDVSRGQFTAAVLVPIDGPALYVMGRIVPLVLVGLWCLWLIRRRAVFAPELGVVALGVAFMLRPLVDPAGLIYYLAPGYAFCVLIRPRSWTWPVLGLGTGWALWLRRSLRHRYTTRRWTPSGWQTEAVGAGLAIGTTLMIVAVTLLAIERAVELTAPDPGGSGGEAAAGGPADAEAGDRVLS